MDQLKDKIEDRELNVQDQVMEFLGLALFFLVLLGSFLKVMFF